MPSSHHVFESTGQRERMASGMGLSGRGRCYPFWRDYALCAEGKPREESRKECGVFVEDYFECLHHRKEKARMRYVEDVRRQQEQAAKSHGSAH